MNGLPLKIKLNGEPFTAYFATRRTGEAGKEMRAAKRRFYDETRLMGSCFSRIAVLGDLAAEKEGEEELMKLLEQSEELTAELSQHKYAAEDAANRYLELSLEGNHGADTESILACFADGEIDDLVRYVEVGDIPEDFFTRRGTRQKKNSTATSSAASSKRSSKPGSRGSSTKKGT